MIWSSHSLVDRRIWTGARESRAETTGAGFPAVAVGGDGIRGVRCFSGAGRVLVIGKMYTLYKNKDSYRVNLVGHLH